MVARTKLRQRFTSRIARKRTPLISRIEPLEGRRLLSSAVPAGPEFRVNTYTQGDQGAGGVAMDANGNFVCTWVSSDPNNAAHTGIYAQRYNTAGVPQGAEFKVNTSTTGGNPRIAMDPVGDFVITWGGGTGLGDSFSGVYAQRFNAAGVKQGPEFRVNTYTPDAQYGASVAMDARGDFTIAWHSQNQDGSLFGIYAQRFAADGTRQGAEFPVNTTTLNQQEWPSVAMDAAGDSVIAWCYNGVGDTDGVFARRYDAAGVPQGSEFRVNTFTPGSQTLPHAAMDPNGNFVITWESNLQDGSSWGIYAQRFSAAGMPLGSEFRVNTYTNNSQFMPSVACDSAGRFVITWCSDGQDGSGQGIFAQRYDATGAPIDGEFQVNTYTPLNQRVPAVATDPAGDFVIAWNSYGQDGSGYGFYAQRYTVPPSVSSASVISPLTRSISALPVQDESGIVYEISAPGYLVGVPADGGPATLQKNGVSDGLGIALDRNGDFILAHFGALDRYTPGSSGYSVIARPPSGSSFIDVAIDGSGNYIVADNEMHRIVRITPDGSSITPVASYPVGNPAGEDAWVRIDGDGNYVLAEDNGSQLHVFRITPSGTVTSVPLSGVPSGQIVLGGMTFGASGDYVVTVRGGQILDITPTGQTRTLAESDALVGAAGIARDPISGNFLVVNNSNNALLTVSADGSSIRTFYSPLPAYAPGFESPDSIVAISPPALLKTVIGDGSAQRSQVRSISLTFDRPVTLAAGAVSLAVYGGNSATGTPSDASVALGTPVSSDGGVTWVVPISSNTANSNASGSLDDGIYVVTVHAAGVTDALSRNLIGGDQSTTFHRLFGDLNGDARVNSADYFQFRKAFGSMTGQPQFNLLFDADGNGSINSADYLAFKLNYGRQFSY